jgi:hypothetical protein
MQYAAYGSNLHALRLFERIPSARFLGTGFLPGWTLHFDKRSRDGSAKCNIRLRGSGVHVAIYQMGKAGKQKLDRIEGVGNGYLCEVLDVPQFGECFVYTASRSHIDMSLHPYDWYKEMVLLGCESHHFPGDYTFRVRAIESSRDPDDERRQLNWKMVETFKNGDQNVVSGQSGE